MAKSKVVVKIDKLAIAKLAGDLKKAEEVVAESALTEINNLNVVPKLTGMLEGSAFIGKQRGKTSVIWDSPQAARLYEHPEYDFTKTENPNAKGEWAEDVIQDKQLHVKVLRAYMKLKGHG